MNIKSIKRAVVLTIPVAAALATVATPASAAVGDYTTKTYIAYDVTTTDKDANNGQVHINGKIPVDATKNGQPATPPSEIGVYYKNDDYKVGVTHDVAKDQNTYYGSVYGDDKSSINGSITPGTDTAASKAELSYTTAPSSDASKTQDTVGVKFTGDDPTKDGDQSSTALYAEEKNADGDKLGVNYNVTNGDVSVYATDSETVGTFDNGTIKEVHEYSYVVADTNPDKA